MEPRPMLPTLPDLERGGGGGIKEGGYLTAGEVGRPPFWLPIDEVDALELETLREGA